MLVGTTFYSYGPGGQLAAQRTRYHLSWIAEYVDGLVAPPTAPAAPPSVPATAGVTVSLRSRAGSLCRIDDLFTAAGAVSVAAGGSAEIQIDGRSFRTVLFLECGRP